MKVYLAGPLFNQSERALNHQIAQSLRDNGYDVWLPQENFPAAVGSEEEKERVFEADLKALRDCEVVVAVLDGECVDSGTAFEVGYAFALEIPLVGIKTDIRVFSKCEEVNLMIEQAVKLIKSSHIQELLDDLLKTLGNLSKNI
ncbi:MAG: nucleoside 2-deoxyribosyltransferase [Archaeoglobaceae archaeon]